MFPTAPPNPPASEAELLARARRVAGRRLADLASEHHVRVPEHLRSHKGWVGNLLEVTLGARAGSKPVPDFEHLGVELKTLPIGKNGRPRESTFVCVAPVDLMHELTWETSHVRRKLHKVLWVPVQADPDLPVAERRVGMPLLWSCDTDPDAAVLREDWEDLTEQIRLGYIDAITGHRGRALQLRPKALTAAETRLTVGEDGWQVPTRPRGFYLRATFTATLLARHYALGGR
ncbi:MAG: DNA mismatch repair endonuclease MutH [Deltaproteobacteria bacterium]|nr:MAG: DNA mismatch repair endonuclease MutH [Deltaproteobacteria bacterium]